MEIKLLDVRAFIPEYATSMSAGMDLRVVLDEPVTLQPGENHLFPHGFAINMADENMVGLIFGRSGLGHKHGIVLSNSVGVIDADYQGQLFTSLRNLSDKPYTVNHGDAVSQIVFQPITRNSEWNVVDEFEATERGTGGFGSTGK